MSPDRHKRRPKAVRMPDGLEAWYETIAGERNVPVNAVIVEALERYRQQQSEPIEVIPLEPKTTTRRKQAVAPQRTFGYSKERQARGKR